MDALIRSINSVKINENDDSDDNKITELISNTTNDYQSSIILNLFTQSNNIYLIDSSENKNNITIHILGSKIKSNIRQKYIVLFHKCNSKFTCNCKNFIFKSNINHTVCKHITFLICKVFSIYDYKFFETKILSNDYKEKLSIINKDSKIWYNHEISVKYINYKFNENIQLVLDNKETCPICCDNLGNKDIISCLDCRNLVHEDCMSIWLNKSDKCVYCRSDCYKDYIQLI